MESIAKCDSHDVANHSFFHTDMGLMSAGEAVRNILRTQQLLQQHVGKVPFIYRPPRGKLSFWKLFRLWWAGMSAKRTFSKYRLAASP